MAKNDKTDNSLWDLIRTGAFCTVFGAMGGGFITYNAENVESNKHFRLLERQLRDARWNFEPTRDSLTNKAFFYKFHLDSLEILFSHTKDSLDRFKRWMEQNRPVFEQKENDYAECNENNSSLESQLQVAQDSLYKCQRTNEYNEESIEQKEQAITECKEQNVLCRVALDSTRRSLREEEKEVKIRDEQIDSIETMLNKHKNRYVMETEFAMLTTCIFGHGNNMTKYEYERQAKCCVKKIRDIQKKYPTDNDIKNISETFEIRNLCNVVDFYDD